MKTKTHYENMVQKLRKLGKHEIHVNGFVIFVIKKDERLILKLELMEHRILLYEYCLLEENVNNLDYMSMYLLIKHSIHLSYNQQMNLQNYL